MFIIFGGRNIPDSLGRARLTPCTACGNKGQVDVIRITRYFTFFYIPIFPMKTVYNCVCRCGSVVELKKEKGEEFMQNPNLIIEDSDYIF